MQFKDYFLSNVVRLVQIGDSGKEFRNSRSSQGLRNPAIRNRCYVRKYNLSPCQVVLALLVNLSPRVSSDRRFGKGSRNSRSSQGLRSPAVRNRCYVRNYNSCPCQVVLALLVNLSPRQYYKSRPIVSFWLSHIPKSLSTLYAPPIQSTSISLQSLASCRLTTASTRHRRPQTPVNHPYNLRSKGRNTMSSGDGISNLKGTVNVKITQSCSRYFHCKI
jgi:hypothetical protein